VSPRRSYLTTAKNAARRTDYYRVEADELDPSVVPPLLFELMLGEVEGYAVKAIDALLAVDDPYEIDPELGSWLAWFLAFQWTRGESFRESHSEMVSEMMREMWSNISDAAIATLAQDMGEEPTPERIAEYRAVFTALKQRRLRVVPQKASIIGLSGEIAATVGELLIGRRWALYDAPLPLVTSDEPVAVVGGTGRPRREESGIAGSGAILFPLSPDRLLAMFHPLLDFDAAATYPELTLTEVAECNLEIAANSTRWVFELPDARFAESVVLPIQPPAASLQVFTSAHGSSLIRSYRLSRWAYATDPPPWPVQRWWRSGWSEPLAFVDWLAAHVTERPD
jgi:hypothetical protein